MGRPKNKPNRVAERAEELKSSFAGLEEGSKLMIEDMLQTYAWYAVSCEDLIDQIDDEGMLIEDSKGNLKEHPALAVLHKTAARKQEYFAKIRTATRQAQGEQEDALMEFIGE